MEGDDSKMTSAELAEAIKLCDQPVINLQKHTTDLEAGIGLPKDPLSERSTEPGAVD